MDVDCTVQEANISYPADSILMKEMCERAPIDLRALLPPGKRELRAVIELYRSLSERKRQVLPWHIRRTLDQVRLSGWRYLLDVGHFVRTHTVKPGKRLAFHAAAVACIKRARSAASLMSSDACSNWASMPMACSDPPEVIEAIRRRRAGIEPLIQHAKSFGLGRSRMKSDETVLASGYRAVMGVQLAPVDAAHAVSGDMKAPQDVSTAPNNDEPIDA